MQNWVTPFKICTPPLEDFERIPQWECENLNPCCPEGFSQTYFPKGGCPLIINTEGTLNLLPVYRYGHPLSNETKISTNHYCMMSL